MSPIDVKPASIVERAAKTTAAVLVTAAATVLFVATGIDVNEEVATPIVGLVISAVVYAVRNR